MLMLNVRVKWILFFITRIWIFQAFVNAKEKYSNETLLSDLNLNSSSRNLSEATSVHLGVIGGSKPRFSGNSTTNGTSEISVTRISVKDWYPADDSTAPNLAFFPVLAIAFFLTITILRICSWAREDQKFKERGCSYDITSYVILTEGDKHFHQLDLSSDYDTISSFSSLLPKTHTNHSRTTHFVPRSPSPPVKLPTSVLKNNNYYFGYDSVTSSRSLQYRIDSQIYDTVKSYNSFLRSSFKKKVADIQPNADPIEDSVTNLNSTDAADRVPPLRKIPGTRFSIVPALNNYVRLKRQHSSSQPSSPVINRKGNPLISEISAIQRTNLKHKVSFRDKCSTSTTVKAEESVVQLVDKAVQVNLQNAPGRRGKRHNAQVTSSQFIEMQEMKSEIRSTQRYETVDNRNPDFYSEGDVKSYNTLNEKDKEATKQNKSEDSPRSESNSESIGNDDISTCDLKDSTFSNNVLVFADVHCRNNPKMIPSSDSKNENYDEVSDIENIQNSTCLDELHSQCNELRDKDSRLIHVPLNGENKCSQVLLHLEPAICDNSTKTTPNEESNSIPKTGPPTFQIPCSGDMLYIQQCEGQRTKSENDLPTVNNNYLGVTHSCWQQQNDTVRSYAKLHNSRISPSDVKTCICTRDKIGQGRKYSLGAISDVHNVNMDKKSWSFFSLRDNRSTVL